MSREERETAAYQDEQREVDNLLILYLQWLESHTGGPKSIPVTEQIAIAAEAKTHGVRPTAKKYGYGPHAIERAIYNVEAARIHHHSLPISHNLHPKVAQKLLTLDAIDREIRQMVVLKESVHFRKTILQLPHVRELVDYYVRYRSLEGLLTPLGIRLKKQDNFAVKKFLTSSDTTDIYLGLTTLAQRYALARWLRTDQTFNKASASEVLLETIVFILGTSINQDLASEIGVRRVRRIQQFLKEIMILELGSVSGGEPNSFLSQEQGILANYQRCLQEKYVPQVLKDYALAFVDGVPQLDRVAALPCGDIAVDWAGIRFLENALTHPPKKGDQHSFEPLLLNTTDILKQAKSVQAIPPRKP